MQYVFNSRVTKVERKRRAMRMRKSPDNEQKIEVEYEDLGWYLHIAPNTSICVGSEEPPWKAGQPVTITIDEKAE